jgi:hypothetical protein
MTEQDKKELTKECLILFGDTACKETYDMAGGISAVVEYLLNKVGKLPIDSVVCSVDCLNYSQGGDRCDKQCSKCENL